MTKSEEKKMLILKNLVYLYFLCHPTTNSRMVYAFWYKNRVLREYDRPEKKILTEWLSEFKGEVYGKN